MKFSIVQFGKKLCLMLTCVCLFSVTLLVIDIGCSLKNLTKKVDVLQSTVNNNITESSANNLYSKVTDLHSWVKQIRKKLSMPDNIFRIKGVKFFVPNYPVDAIQSIIVDKNKFFEQGFILGGLDKYIKPAAVIVDAGANIGNHSLYWALNCKPTKIFSFEPVHETFDILRKNVEINGLQDKIELFNFGLSDAKTRSDIDTFTVDNIGATRLYDNIGGEFEMKKLDDIVESADFVKIDVEGHEIQLLNGAKNLLTSSKPIILIESFADNYPEVLKILTDLGYKLEKTLPYDNYLFVHKNQERFWEE